MLKNGKDKGMFADRWRKKSRATINQEITKNLKKQSNCTQVLECIEKISALETEIGDASTMRLVLFLLLAPTGALTVTVIYYSI